MLNDLEQRRDKPVPGKPELDWLQGQGAAPVAKRGKKLIYLLLLLLLAALAVATWKFGLPILSDYKAASVSVMAQSDNTVTRSDSAQAKIENPVDGRDVDISFTSLHTINTLSGDKPGLRFELDKPVDFQSKQLGQRLLLRMSDTRSQLGVSHMDFAAPLGSLIIKEDDGGVSFELRVDEGLLSSVGQSASIDGGSVVEIQFERAAAKQVDKVDSNTAVAILPVKPSVAAAKDNKVERSVASSKQSKPSAKTSDIKQFVPLSREQQDSKIRSEARKLLGAGNSLAAQTLLENFIAQQPLALRSGEMLASIYLSQQRFAKTRSLLDVLRGTYPADAGLLGIEARLLLLEGQADKAVNLLMTYKPDISAHQDYYELLGLATRKNEQYLLSEQVYKGLLDVNAGRGDRWVGLAIALDAQGKNGAARSAFREALKTRTTSPALADYAQRRLNAVAR